MEKVFITMHDLSPEAKIVYASDTISDVLGYAPHEVVGRSCFDYFHPDEMASAKKVHSRGVQLDKAAMLIYCQVRRKDGEFSFCECIFSIVYDVFVAAVSIHSNSSKSEGRALTAPIIRRVFSSSPSDPRYHMLTHLSSKFQGRPRGSHEPRAVLILNRFTRSLTILYASHALAEILDFPPSEAVGKSFYECISQHCLQDGVEALERAKENDSIAYLRFQWRDPRSVDRTRPRLPPRRSTRSKRKRSVAEDRDDQSRQIKKPTTITRKSERNKQLSQNVGDTSGSTNGNTNGEGSSNGASSSAAPNDIAAALDEAQNEEVDGVLTNTSDDNAAVRDVEAVVSCTSDGLVVVLRAARPMIPKPLHGTRKGIYASPWAEEPLGVGPSSSASETDLTKNALMDTIQEVAVFAWSLRELGGEVILSDDKREMDATTRAIAKSKEIPIVRPKRNGIISNGSSSSSSSNNGSNGSTSSNGSNSTPATTASRTVSEAVNEPGPSPLEKDATGMDGPGTNSRVITVEDEKWLLADGNAAGLQDETVIIEGDAFLPKKDKGKGKMKGKMREHDISTYPQPVDKPISGPTTGHKRNSSK